MLTGKAIDKNVEKVRFHRINGFLIKPPKVNTLKNAIRHALGQ